MIEPNHPSDFTSSAYVGSDGLIIMIQDSAIPTAPSVATIPQLSISTVNHIQGDPMIVFLYFLGALFIAIMLGLLAGANIAYRERKRHERFYREVGDYETLREMHE